MSSRPDDLFEKAKQSLLNAYAPYTNIKVGVAVEMIDGNVYTGSNFENAAYMHGLDAFESAVGQLLVNGNWARTGNVPQIKTVFHCFEKKPARESLHYPGAISMEFLKLWTLPETLFLCADSAGDVFARYKGEELFDGKVAPVVDLKIFTERTKARYEEEIGKNPFREEPLKTLYNVRLQAFDPISHYAVSAMVKTTDGDVFYGCNAEPGSNKALHAEGTALAAMVNQKGPQVTIESVTVMTAGNIGFPCGGCRQHINEFATDDTRIIAMNASGQMQEVLHRDLLPHSFGRADLQSGSVESAVSCV